MVSCSINQGDLVVVENPLVGTVQAYGYNGAAGNKTFNCGVTGLCLERARTRRVALILIEGTLYYVFEHNLKMLSKHS